VAEAEVEVDRCGASTRPRWLVLASFGASFDGEASRSVTVDGQ
jgi:hypothetical protein